MTKILLLSDTHGYLDEQMLKYVHLVDEVWHAGDIGNLTVTDTIATIKPVRAVFGNIDGDKARLQFPIDIRFKIENKKVWITHIGGYPNRYEKRIREELKLNPPDILICGHSHILKIMYDKKFNFLYLNPGAAGKSGYHKVRTMIRFSIDGNLIENMEIIELEQRV